MINITAGEDVQINIEFNDEYTEADIDITDWTLYMYIYDAEESGTAIITKTWSVVSWSTGIAKFVFADTDLADVTAGRYFYQVWMLKEWVKTRMTWIKTCWIDPNLNTP